MLILTHILHCKVGETVVQEQDAHIISMINGVEKQTFYLRQTLNFVMFLLWIVENMFLSFLESKILLWKVNFYIYFPQWQVMSKVSAKPCNSPINKGINHDKWYKFTS